MLVLLAALATTATAAEVFGYQLHGGGSYAAAPLMRRALATLQERSRMTIGASYRVTGTFEAQKEFVEFDRSVAQLNHFKV